MSEEKHPVWQSLMNESYNRWNKEGDLKGKSKRDFLSALEPKQRQAVLLGNLDSQVCNGGFSQWVMNGYALSFDMLWEVMVQIPGESANKVREMLKEIEPYLLKNKDGVRDQGFMGDYWKVNKRRNNYSGSYDDEDDQEEENEGWAVARELDDKYYEINDPQFMDEIEAFLSGAVQPRNPKLEPPQLCKVPLALVGEDGNAFAILGRFQHEAHRQGWPKEEIEKVVKKAIAGNYDDLLCTIMEHTIEN